MKLNKMITSPPFLLFIILALIGLLIPSSLIPFWILKFESIENEVKMITDNSHKEIQSAVRNAADSLLILNSSTINLAKVAGDSLSNSNPTFFDIETKVTPLLFQALVTIPRLSQISYISKDGLFFALYFNAHQEIFATYSNTSFSTAMKARTNYIWYSQPFNCSTRKLHGDAVIFAPKVLVNESWFQQALNTTSGCASLGESWNDVDNVLILNSAGMDNNGAISLGFELKPLIDVLYGNIPFGGGLYLATKDGKVLRHGIPNTRMVFDGNSSISFHLFESNGNRIGKNVSNITFQLNDDRPQASIMDIFGKKYILYSSSLNIIGLQLMYVLALPYDGLQSHIHKNIIFTFVILIVMFITVAISIFSFVVLALRAAGKEMCLRAALIRQKEATQQVERKSKNQSLAFVTASHDIRASLAGITGLIELSTSEVDQRSDLAKNLRLVQICSKDLYGILNSILDSSKIEAGKMQLVEKQFDLAEVLEGVVDLFYPVGLKKQVDVILDLYDGSLTKFSKVKGDERRLKQILSNLLSNGIKFTSEGHVSVRAWARKPSLEMSTFPSPHNQSTRCLPSFFFKNYEAEAIDVAHHDPSCMEFVFEVNDTGKGIQKEKQKSIFEDYVQVKDADPEFEGTGLGLGIVQSLVRLMGGEITIVDKGVGEKGTCFRFNTFFKVCQSDISEEDKPESLCTLSSGSNTPFSSPNQRANRSSSSQVILFIRGDERRRVTQRFLETQGVKVTAVECIKQLSETFKEFNQEHHNICSSRSDLNLSFGYLSWPPSRNSSTRSKEFPLSAMDGTDELRFQRRSKSSFILLVIDTKGVDFRELVKTVAQFRKHSTNACYRVVWLGSRCIQLQGIDEKKLPPSDLIIQMPLHGSRLNALIGLLPEFGGIFPCTPPHANQPPRKEEEMKEICGAASPLRGRRVLVAEDDCVQQRIAKSVLLKLGSSVEMCRNGEEALTFVFNGLSQQSDLGASHIPPYDYILMDCQMPVMDGCEATKQIRLKEKDYGVHIPIIGLTAHTEGEELNELFVAGIDIHLFKPLNGQKLLKVIEDLHNRK